MGGYLLETALFLPAVDDVVFPAITAVAVIVAVVVVIVAVAAGFIVAVMAVAAGFSPKQLGHRNALALIRIVARAHGEHGACPPLRRARTRRCTERAHHRRCTERAQHRGAWERSDRRDGTVQG